jgi:LysR family nitrogen assimilation transcriptional regulator
MNLRQLMYFVKIVEFGNMSRAAEQLHVAQPALGMQIRQLEEQLGVALLIRHSRGVEPTKAGQILHTRAIAILKLVEEASREISECDQDGIENIRLGMTPTLMMIMGPDLAIAAREQAPQIFLSLSEEMSQFLPGALEREEIDLALAYDVPEALHLSQMALLQEDLVCVTLPGKSNGKSIDFAEILEGPLVLPEQLDANRRLVERAARDIGLDLRVTYEVRSVSAMKQMVLRGLGTTIMPYAGALEEVRAGKLDARPIVSPNLRRTLALVSLSRRKPLRNELALLGVVRSCLQCITDALGPFAHPISPKGT